MPAGSRACLAARSAARERLRALAVVPRAVVAADRVVVGDGAAVRDDRLARRRLDLVPHRDLGAAAARRDDGEVRRRPVRVDVGEPAGDQPRRRSAARRGAASRPPRAAVERGPTVHAVSNVSTTTPSRASASRRYGAPQERVAARRPAAPSPAAACAVRPCRRGPRHRSTARSSRASTGWSADSKPSSSRRRPSVAPAPSAASQRVEQPAVARAQPRLGDRPDGGDAVVVLGERAPTPTP